jgi:hypothetical protein
MVPIPQLDMPHQWHTIQTDPLLAIVGVSPSSNRRSFGGENCSQSWRKKQVMTPVLRIRPSGLLKVPTLFFFFFRSVFC